MNNAGYTPHRGAKATVDGYEAGLLAMHLGHFLLTELLLSNRPDATSPVRIVNVASGMHYKCFTADCFDEERFLEERSA